MNNNVYLNRFNYIDLVTFCLVGVQELMSASSALTSKAFALMTTTSLPDAKAATEQLPAVWQLDISFIIYNRK